MELMKSGQFSKFDEQTREAIQAYLEGRPIEIKFVHGTNTWQPFPNHFRIDAFNYWPNYLFRDPAAMQQREAETFVTWGT